MFRTQGNLYGIQKELCLIERITGESTPKYLLSFQISLASLILAGLLRCFTFSE